MEKIKNKKELLEIIKDLRAVEIKARDDYRSNIMTFKNFEIVETFKKIKKEEDIHIKILENIIKTINDIDK
jgi:rubrerythrin